MEKLKATLVVKVSYYQGFDQNVPQEITTRLKWMFIDDQRLAVKRKLTASKFDWDNEFTALKVQAVWRVIDASAAQKVLESWLKPRVWNVASSIYDAETISVEFKTLEPK
jgi:hypothetical protein